MIKSRILATIEALTRIVNGSAAVIASRNAMAQDVRTIPTTVSPAPAGHAQPLRLAASKESSRNSIKLLAAGLTAIVMLATPAMARDSYAARRHAEAAYTRTAPSAQSIDDRSGIPALRVKALTPPPDGDSCDVGDDPFIC